MVDVKKLLIDTLTDEFGYPVFLQGSLSEDDAYPEAFFTYWNNETNDDAFYSNAESWTIWNFDLNFYANDPVLVNTALLDAKLALKAVGFIPNGSGYDVISDEITHTGRGINLTYIQKKERSEP